MSWLLIQQTLQKPPIRKIAYTEPIKSLKPVALTAANKGIDDSMALTLSLVHVASGL